MYDIFESKYTAQKKLGWLMGGMYFFLPCVVHNQNPVQEIFPDAQEFDLRQRWILLHCQRANCHLIRQIKIFPSFSNLRLF